MLISTLYFTRVGEQNRNPKQGPCGSRSHWEELEMDGNRQKVIGKFHFLAHLPSSKPQPRNKTCINNIERLKAPSDEFPKTLQHGVAVLSQHHFVTIPAKILPKAFKGMKNFKRLNSMRIVLFLFYEEAHLFFLQCISTIF